MAQKTSTKKKGTKQSTALVETAVVQMLQPEEGTPQSEESMPEEAIPEEAIPEESMTQSEEAKTEAEAESAPTEQEFPQPEKIEPASKPAAVKPLTMVYLNSELEALKQIVSEHGQQIAELQEALARKRKAVPNGKVQIQDKQTGMIYPSKNNCYQTLLKSGELQALVDKGVFGGQPTSNSFGWYSLNRAYPNRFQEVRPDNEQHT